MRHTPEKTPIGPSGHFPRKRGKNEDRGALPTDQNPANPPPHEYNDAQERWRDWFSFAVLRLGLSPDAFWRLSFAEWRWLLAAVLGEGPPMNGAALRALVEKYPDRKP
jgi:uncharacterized phage protein (TIGR02216 family)